MPLVIRDEQWQAFEDGIQDRAAEKHGTRQEREASDVPSRQAREPHVPGTEAEPGCGRAGTRLEVLGGESDPLR